VARVITAKAMWCLGIAVVSIPLAFGIRALGNVVGFMLGVAIRSTPGTIVAYFVYSQSALFEGVLSAQQWAHLGVTGVIWLLIPLSVGLAVVVRAEVK
jgi:ABC-2 type transport system permease protein